MNCTLKAPCCVTLFDTSLHNTVCWRANCRHYKATLIHFMYVLWLTAGNTLQTELYQRRTAINQIIRITISETYKTAFCQPLTKTGACVYVSNSTHYDKPPILMPWPNVHIMQLFAKLFRAKINERESIDWRNSTIIVICRRELNNSIINYPHSSIRIRTLNIRTHTLHLTQYNTV